MEQAKPPVDTSRVQALKDLLTRLRGETLARVRDLRALQDADALAPPSDELDVARSLAEVETHAALIERAEYRWKAIEAAFGRLERGRYGICEECGEGIALERLKVLPFAAYCVDCQAKRNEARKPGEGAVDERSGSLWEVPEEVDESLEKQDALAGPEEGLVVHEEKPFGPEIGEFEQLTPVPTARRRGRVKKKEVPPES